MKVTVVGYWHAFPAKGEAASGYLLEENGYRVLIDCGSGVVSQLQHYCELWELDAVVISHYHNDHIGDIGAIHYHRLLLPYIMKEDKKRPFAIFGHQEDEQGFKSLSFQDVVPVYPYEPGNVLQLGSFTFSFYPTLHPVPCFAMKITSAEGTLFYTADTSFSIELAEEAKGVDLLIAECSLYKGQDGTKMGHMNSEEAGRMAKISHASHLLLTHLPHFGDHRLLVEEAKRECLETEVTLAHSGWSKTF